MAKTILILETSATLQKIFTETLDKEQYTLEFVTDGRKALYYLFEFPPDLFLLNFDIQSPRSFEIVRILRSMDCFEDLAIGMYANFPTPLDEVFALECGVTSFIRLDRDSFVQKVAVLAELSVPELDNSFMAQKQGKFDDTFLFQKTAELLHWESRKNAMLEKLLNLIDSLESLEEIVKSFLLFIAEVCEVPIAALYVVENDGPHGYFVSSGNIGKKEIADFLNVCVADFGSVQKNYDAVKIVPKRLGINPELDRFFSETVQLSSYESETFKTISGSKRFGTVHIVSEGNITREKRNLFLFCVKNAAPVFDKALIVKEKIFFEKRIRRAFSRFVPEEIIDSLVMQSDEKNEKISVGETRAVAILFSDIRAFTNISEKNKADVLVAFLNRYFSTMVEIIKKHGGTIDKFIGDAIMAEFGTPVSYKDNCRRAVAAACEMRAALPTVELGDLVLPEGMKFNIGIGIHYGDIIVGSIGSKDKTDYSVIGDNVNLASRLEGLTKTYGTQILVSQSVLEDAGEDSFCFRHLDDVRVKGKKDAVSIYAVDRSEDEFPFAYKDSYIKGMDLYKQGIWNLARDYFEKALSALPGDKAAKLMFSRCAEFIKNPPKNWDGAIAFVTK
ncbi:MAG: guanylate cyclase [Treponema sp.]|nr:guanylate cyclase [Treponema sp.]